MKKKKTWIEAHEGEQFGGSNEEQCPRCKGCIYVAEDVEIFTPPHSFGYNQPRCKMFPGKDREAFSDFKPDEYQGSFGEECPHKKTK